MIPCNAQKLALLQRNFNPIPVSPTKTLDFSAHEDLFRALDLWDFANLDLSFDLRSDLLIPFIANYDPSNYLSFVNNVEISCTRSELARALRLGETHQDVILKDESKAVIEEFVLNYILLEGDDDEMCILPESAMSAIELVNESRANEIDWAELMWVLIEKEIHEAPRLKSCRFASHIQCLMKFQQPGLFQKEELEDYVEVLDSSDEDEEAEVLESSDEDEEAEVLDSSDEDEEVEDGLGTYTTSLEDGDSTDCIEQCNGDEEENWVHDGKDEAFEHCLRRCNVNEVRGITFENLCKEEFSNLEGIHVMDEVQVSYAPNIKSFDQGTGEFELMTVDKNVNKHFDIIDIDEDENGAFYQNERHKRTRTDLILEEQAPSSFDLYMEQIQCAMLKAKKLYDEKDQECFNAQFQIQYLNELLKQKDLIIQNMEKARVEEHERWQNTVSWYEHELNVLVNLMAGYKRALKKTQNKFEEYRKKCPQGNEHMCRDGGVLFERSGKAVV